MRPQTSSSATLTLVPAVLLCLGVTGAAVRQAKPADHDFAHQAAVAIAHGQREEAARLANARGASDPDAAVVLAQLAEERGKYKDAQALLEPIVARDKSGAAALELALLYRTIGRNNDAVPLLEAVANRAANSSEPYVLYRAARAAQALKSEPKIANSLYRDAEKAGADTAMVETAWGLLFLERDTKNEPLKSFDAALKADPNWAPAHVGMARLFEDDDGTKAAAEAERAAQIDPGLVEPHLILADMHLDADREKEARAEIDKALAINPDSLEAHAILAGMAYVKDDKNRFDAEVAKALAIDPSYGDVYRVSGEQAASHYRFDEAVALAQKALTLDPTDAHAAADLGMHLMRTGDEAGARRALEASFKVDPYQGITFNLLHVLDNLDQFATVQEGDLIFKMRKDQAPVLREYAVPLAQEAFKTLSSRYGFTPTGPFLIEIFTDHDDFAVRNLGLPGMIGALGACFGRVVTMDSPTARDPGTFSWQATLWHELTHVITIQMSKQRIPRWLTEGISVYEEGRQRPEWGRDMEVTFARAMNKKKVLKLKDLNAGFTRGETIVLAYYEASLLVDHIVSTKGQGALNSLIRSYGEGIDNEAALNKTLGISIDDLQASFDKFLEDKFGSMRHALMDADKPVDASSLDKLKANAAANPESYIAQLALGEQLAKNGDPSGFAPLQRASVLVPTAIGSESPHAVMAELAMKLGDKPRAMKEYELFLDSDHTNIEGARRLLQIAQGASDDAALTYALTRIVALDPFDASAHVGWGRLALKRKEAATAVREFRAALASGAPDKAATHCDLGESYLLAGQKTEAKKEALAAMEIAPSYERAQELLLNASGGKG